MTPADLPPGYDYETARRLADQTMARTACMQQNRAALRQAEATSHAGGAMAAAAGAGGLGARPVVKTIGVGTARVVRGQVQQIAANPC